MRSPSLPIATHCPHQYPAPPPPKPPTPHAAPLCRHCCLKGFISNVGNLVIVVRLPGSRFNNQRNWTQMNTITTTITITTTLAITIMITITTIGGGSGIIWTWLFVIHLLFSLFISNFVQLFIFDCKGNFLKCVLNTAASCSLFY